MRLDVAVTELLVAECVVDDVVLDEDEEETT